MNRVRLLLAFVLAALVGAAIGRDTQPVALGFVGPIQLLSATAANADVLVKTGQLPAAVGQTTMAASLSIAIASDQSNVPVTLSSITAANGNVLANSGQFPTALGTANTGAQSFTSTQSRGSQYTHFHVNAVGSAGILVDATARRLRMLECSSSNNTTTFWFMLFDKSSAPVNNDVPWYQKTLIGNAAAVNTTEFDFGLDGAPLASGLGIAFSSTRGVLTLAAGNTMSCDVYWST